MAAMGSKRGGRLPIRREAGFFYFEKKPLNPGGLRASDTLPVSLVLADKTR